MFTYTPLTFICVILFQLGLFNITCPSKVEAIVTPIEFQQFLKEYYEIRDRGGFSGSEIAYAIEKDYDEMTMFCIDKLPLGNINYIDYQKIYRNNKNNHYVYHLYCRCVIKNKLDALRAILNKYPDIAPNGSEFYSSPTPSKIETRQIMNMAIEERFNSLKWVKLLANFGADLNITEDHYGYGIGHSRTPLQAAIVRNKLDVVEFLLNKNVDPNTGLLTAITCRNNEALILLINFGADPHNNNGYPLREALRLGYDEIVNTLTAVYFNEQFETNPQD